MDASCNHARRSKYTLLRFCDGDANRLYDFYVFDPDAYRLERVEVFAVSDGDSPLSNPRFDIERRIITSSMKSGNEWPRWQFFFDGERYIRDVDWVRIHGVEKDTGE